MYKVTKHKFSPCKSGQNCQFVDVDSGMVYDSAEWLSAKRSLAGLAYARLTTGAGKKPLGATPSPGLWDKDL